VNAFVGAMVGLEQTVVPLIGKDTFHIESNTLILSFIASFGMVKANLTEAEVLQLRGQWINSMLDPEEVAGEAIDESFYLTREEDVLFEKPLFEWELERDVYTKGNPLLRRKR